MISNPVIQVKIGIPCIFEAVDCVVIDVTMGERSIVATAVG